MKYCSHTCPFIPESPEFGVGKPVTSQHLLQREEGVTPVPEGKSPLAQTLTQNGCPQRIPTDAPGNPQLSPLSSSSGAILFKFFMSVSSMGLLWKTFFLEERKRLIYGSARRRVGLFKTKKKAYEPTSVHYTVIFLHGRHHNCSPGHPQHQGT